MESRPIVLAQFGCGYWGPNLLRTFSSLPNCQVRYVVDPSAARRSFVATNFPPINVIESFEVALRDPEVNAVIVATPAATHFNLAKQALQSDKHCFVEKPLATSVAEVDELAQYAEQRKLVVMAGHTFLYNAAVRYVKNIVAAGDLGDIRYIYSQRLNLGRIRSDIDALWNFAPHDISIIQYWLGNLEPLSVFKQGMDYIQPGVDDVVFLSIVYPGKIIANVHVSWLDPQRVRRMTIVGTRKMVIYDDTADDKVAIYDKGIEKKAVLGENMDFDNPHHTQFSYRSSGIVMPHIMFAEPLRVEAEHFLDCIRNGLSPITDISHARTVVSIMERARSYDGVH